MRQPSNWKTTSLLCLASDSDDGVVVPVGVAVIVQRHRIRQETQRGYHELDSRTAATQRRQHKGKRRGELTDRNIVRKG